MCSSVTQYSVCFLLLFLPGLSAWRDCPYGSWTVNHGEWYDGMSKRCYCNDGNWERCTNLPHAAGLAPISPDPVYGQCLQSGVYYTPQSVRMIDGRECTCIGGQWDCSDQTPYYDPCYDREGRRVNHGEWYTSRAGDICYCNDGSGDLCRSPPPRGCWVDGYKAENGEWVDTNSQRCLCSDGKLTKCRDLCEAGRSQVMFLFDTSTSIKEDKDGSSESSVGRENWESMRRFTSEVVEDVPVGYRQTRIGYTSFADRPNTRIFFTSPESANKNALLRSLRNWYPEIDGQTYLGRAMRHVRDLYEDRDLREDNSRIAKVLVILTDGNADDDIKRVSRDMRRDGFNIFAIGVGNVEYDQLIDLAGQSSRVLLVDDFGRLADNINFLRNAVCQYYV
mmetsp:Transcript_29055/g.69429  ORF Transcript_29055/g.69429 Transcript_29055/m.69429 type:complete len:392 (+) Transcript_29055:160-1335(+)